MKITSETTPVFSAAGQVVHGRGIGKLVGTPTANLQLDHINALPQAGVYVTKILLEGQTHYGVTHIGKRPTVDNGNNISIETHVSLPRGDWGLATNNTLLATIELPKFDTLPFSRKIN